MASIPVASQNHPQNISTHRRIFSKSSNDHRKEAVAPLCSTRRMATAAVLATILQAREAILNPKAAAFALEFGFIAPDQTLEEAEAGIKVHSRELVELKSLIKLQSWRELQTALRESSSNLKQDLYTIIQTRPGSERPQLRKLYSILFNNVTRMDYAARSKDARLVQEHYHKVVAILDDIFTRI